MNFVTTLVGIAHGLIFIPVILAYFGPNVNKALLYEQQQEATKGKDKTLSGVGLLRTSTSSPSRIFEALVPVLKVVADVLVFVHGLPGW